MKNISKEIEAQKEIFKPLKEEKPLLRVEYFDDRFYKGTFDRTFNNNSVEKLFPKYDSRIVLRDKEFDLYMDSVTTVLGKSNPMPFLAKWRGDIGNLTADYIIREALDLVSHVHNACEHYVKGFPVIFRNEKTNFPTMEMISEFENIYFLKSQEAMVMVNRFKQLLELFNPVINEIEKTVYKIEENIIYAGTCDYIMTIQEGEYSLGTRTKIKIPKTGKYLIDLKSGKSTDKEMFLQTSAYTKCLNEIEGNMIWHLNADRRTGIKGVDVLLTTEIDYYYEHFCNLYKTYWFKNKDLKPNLYEFETILQTKKYI